MTVPIKERNILGTNFPQFDKCPRKYTSKSRQAETKPVFKKTFFMKILVNTAALKAQMIIN